MENDDVDGAAPRGDAPTTSQWSTNWLSTKVRLILESWRYFFWGLLGNVCHICFILIDHLYSRHFWQSTIKHNSIKCIKHAVKRYYVHNKSGIYVHNTNKKYRYIFVLEYTIRLEIQWKMNFNHDYKKNRMIQYICKKNLSQHYSDVIMSAGNWLINPV